MNHHRMNAWLQNITPRTRLFPCLNPVLLQSWLSRLQSFHDIDSGIFLKLTEQKCFSILLYGVKLLPECWLTQYDNSSFFSVVTSSMQWVITFQRAFVRSRSRLAVLSPLGSVRDSQRALLSMKVRNLPLIKRLVSLHPILSRTIQRRSSLLCMWLSFCDLKYQCLT